ncbi:MAG: polysaccharide deacetylase family protein [Porticoccaceae bacterium]|nr:polysaccharide deacetylase family protein [Porticoccaceae bacterium]
MPRFTILMYHMISQPGTIAEAKYACPPERFEQHLRYIQSSHHCVVSLDEIEQHLLNDTALPDNAVAITLDDGFEDNYTQAFPLLQKYGMPASIFLATGVMGATNKWMQGRDFPERSMLNWQQIEEMNRYQLSFGAHTVNHAKLSELDTAAAEEEISQSKQQVEDQLGTSCSHFAYPYGLFSEQSPEIVKSAGFTLACSTRSGFNNSQRDPFLLHRIEVYGTDPVWKLKQKMTFGMNDAARLFPLKYYSKQVLQRVGL